MSSEPNAALVVRADREPGAGSTARFRWPRLSVEPRPLGALAADAVRVRMLLIGVCGTDLHVARADPSTGYVLGSAPLEIGAEGRVLGHEGVGRIVAVGESVPGSRVGEIVTFESILTCRRCVPCRRGRFNQCREARLVGTQIDGLFRETVDVPAAVVHDVSGLARTRAGLRAAACIEPAACAHVAVTRLRVRPGERVLVFGAGPIGLLAAMLCREAFGAVVDVVEPVPLRRELAATWADRTYEVEEFFAEALAADSYDVVIEASGVLGNVGRAFSRVGACGRVGLLARSGEALHLAAVDHWITNGITIVGSRGHLGGAFDDVLRLIRCGRLDLDRIVTGVVDGLGALGREMLDPEPLERRHSKVLARFPERD